MSVFSRAREMEEAALGDHHKYSPSRLICTELFTPGPQSKVLEHNDVVKTSSSLQHATLLVHTANLKAADTPISRRPPNGAYLHI